MRKMNDGMTEENRECLKALSVEFGREITRYGDLSPQEVELVARGRRRVRREKEELLSLVGRVCGAMYAGGSAWPCDLEFAHGGWHEADTEGGRVKWSGTNAGDRPGRGRANLIEDLSACRGLLERIAKVDDLDLSRGVKALLLPLVDSAKETLAGLHSSEAFEGGVGGADGGDGEVGGLDPGSRDYAQSV